VADLAGQIRDLACQDDDQPFWAPPGSHPSTPLIGDIAVWRAARGIDPKTHGQPAETNPKLSRPSGNNTSTELSPAPSSRTTPTPINDSRRAKHSSMVTATSSVRIKHHGRTLHLRPAASDRNQGDITLAGGFVWSDGAADCRFWLFEIMAARLAAGRCAACVHRLHHCVERVGQ
jgi:hypothetical protein